MSGETDSVNPLKRSFPWLFFQALTQVLGVLWLSIRVRGTHNVPRSGPALLISNHQSFLDPVLVSFALARPAALVGRDTLFNLPFFGRIIRMLRGIPIDREGGGSTALRESVNRLREGLLVGIFPEGTRSQDGELQPFKPGFTTILRRANVPVIPVGVDGAHLALPKGSLPRLARVRVVYGKPIPFEEFAELTRKDRLPELVELIESRVAECFTEARQWRNLSRQP